MNPIELSLFSSRLNAVCDEMGAQLRRAAFSPNIRDRLDYSCAVFDHQGELCAQAAHIPVHLGSMAFAMRDIVAEISWQQGDILILNDPYKGGTHLPDVTVIAPVFVSTGSGADSELGLAGFVANRAHHADIGAESPGSMPISNHLQQEGLLIPPTFLVRAGRRQEDAWQRLMAAARNPADTLGDYQAQISANQRGLQRVSELVSAMGLAHYRQALMELNDYAERLAAQAIADIPEGEYQFEDVMDDDGQGRQNIPIRVTLRRITEAGNARVEVDFRGTHQQVAGNINCPISVAAAAVFYVFRCLMQAQTPACAGAFRLIRLSAPKACLVNAESPAAVAAGNVETSMRISDVVMGALAQALPERIPAASGGSMNNLALGAVACGDTQGWDYYETIGNGAGAADGVAGQSAVQTHMTNTLNTPIETMELKYPLRVTEYSIRRHSGGHGRFPGGDGIVREIEFLQVAQATVLSERRTQQPWGLYGGGPGKSGRNSHNGKTIAAKVEISLKPGDKLKIETPGGGGYAERVPAES